MRKYGPTPPGADDILHLLAVSLAFATFFHHHLPTHDSALIAFVERPVYHLLHLSHPLLY
jgi:hypothetical protein